MALSTPLGASLIPNPPLPNIHRYHLKDVVLGKIYFLLVRIKIKHMELAIIRRESAGMGACTALHACMLLCLA